VWWADELRAQSLLRDADGNSVDPAESLEDWLSEASTPVALGDPGREATISTMLSL
jgi:hypothetical protein